MIEFPEGDWNSPHDPLQSTGGFRELPLWEFPTKGHGVETAPASEFLQPASRFSSFQWALRKALGATRRGLRGAIWLFASDVWERSSWGLAQPTKMDLRFGVNSREKNVDRTWHKLSNELVKHCWEGSRSHLL